MRGESKYLHVYELAVGMGHEPHYAKQSKSRIKREANCAAAAASPGEAEVLAWYIAWFTNRRRGMAPTEGTGGESYTRGVAPTRERGGKSTTPDRAEQGAALRAGISHIWGRVSHEGGEEPSTLHTGEKSPARAEAEGRLLKRMDALNDADFLRFAAVIENLVVL
mgnify:CR=1 FL=1